MKSSLMLATLFFSISLHAGIIKEKFPTIPVTDAMGTKKVSLKNFCITEDNQTLKGRISFCKKATRYSRGYKRCTSRMRYHLVQLENLFTYTVRGPRDRVVEYSYSIDPVLEIEVVDFDPRGSEEVIETYDYVLPICR